MSKFNESVTKKTKTTNLAGGDAFVMTPELELISALLTSFLEDKYYESGAKRQTRIEDLLSKVDPKFAAKASIFARTEFGMRSVSHVVAGWISQNVKGQEWTKDYFDSIVYRPDDMMEILSYVKSNGGKQSHAMRKGFAKAFGRFDAYQLAKYRASGKAIKLVDVVNTVHPQHTEQIGQLVRDELRNTNTFEAKLSGAGQGAETKEEAWADLISSNRIGYMALVKNLRNIINQSNDGVVDGAVRILTDDNRIKKSLLLPFRFLTAYNELENVSNSSKVLTGLSDALDKSFANVPHFDGKTLVVIDHSGSMGSGSQSHFGKGAMFGLALARSSGADLMHFGDTAEYLSFNKNDSTLTLMKWLDGLNGYSGWGNSSNGYVGHGTNLSSVFEKADKAYDRILIISDMQVWQSYGGNTSLERYKKKTGANPFVYSWDMAGYGSLQFPENRVATLAGWSEKTFEIMKLVETDKKALVNKINSIEL